MVATNNLCIANYLTIPSEGWEKFPKEFLIPLEMDNEQTAIFVNKAEGIQFSASITDSSIEKIKITISISPLCSCRPDLSFTELMAKIGQMAPKINFMFFGVKGIKIAEQTRAYYYLVELEYVSQHRNPCAMKSCKNKI
jgi:hypothetical protein